MIFPLLYQKDGCRLNDVQGVNDTFTKTGALNTSGQREPRPSSSYARLAQQNAPVTLTEPGRRPVALPAPSQTTGRHEFSLTSAVPSRALATAGASASAFSSEVA